MKRLRLFCLVYGLAAVAAAAASAFPRYEGRLLTDAAGHPITGEARAINDLGQIVGTSTSRGAFLWQEGELIDLPELAGTQSGTANAINNAGDIVGWAKDTSVRTRPCLWRDGQVRELAPPVSAELQGHVVGGRAWDINDKGEVVGSLSLDFGPPAQIPFYWTEQESVVWEPEPPDISGYYRTEARAINDQGQILGGLDEYYGIYGIIASHIGVWTKNQQERSSTASEWYSNRQGYDINNKGVYVGYQYIKLAGANRAFSATIPSGGTSRDLWTLGGKSSAAYALNEAGAVVGQAELPDGTKHAVLWQDWATVDLDPGDHYRNSAAYGINEKGQIVGYIAFSEGTKQAALWTPVPEITGIVPDGEGGVWIGFRAFGLGAALTYRLQSAPLPGGNWTAAPQAELMPVGDGWQFLVPMLPDPRRACFRVLEEAR